MYYKRKYLFIIITLFCCGINAHNFESNGIYYNILSDSTVSVTFRGNKYDSYSNEYYGEIVIPDSINYKGNSYYVDLIGSDAFYGCSAIISIKLPEHLTRIGARAFMWCKNLLSINIPPNVTFIGDGAFENCKKIKKIQLPDKLTKINNSVFWDCEQLSSVVIGSECTEIGRDAFYSCDKLTNIVIPDAVSSIGANAFQDSGVDSVCIGMGIKSIASAAFGNCSIKKIVCKATTPPSIYDAFSNFNATVEVPVESLEIYQNHYYWGQFYIKAIGMPDEERNFSVQGVRYTVTVSQEEAVVSGNESNNDSIIIPGHVINGGTTYKVTGIKKIGANVKSVAISGDVEYIEDDAFTGCKSLQSLILKDSGTPLSIGHRSGSYNGKDSEDALFYDCKLNNIYIGRNLDYSTSYYYEQYSPFFSNPMYEKIVTIGDSVTQIKDYMFENVSLKSVNIPKHVQRIGKRAFADNGNLKGIVLDIPASCTHIGSEAFSGCASGIDSISVSADNLYYDSREDCNALIETRSNTLLLGCKSSNIPNSVTSIGEGAFRSKYNFSGLKNIYIPESVTSIGNSAFENCTGLKSIIIPSNVSTIGMNAFKGCKNLHKVTFMGEYINMFNNIAENIDTLLIPYSKVVGVYSGFTSLKKLDIGGAEKISPGALAGLTELTDLTIPFVGCGSKATATGENGVIGAMFYNEYNSKMRQITQYYNDKESRKSYVPANLEKLTITDECDELGYGALYGMSMLKEITLPSSLYLIGERAFYGCGGLEHIYNEGTSPAACFENTFMGVRTTSCILYVPNQTEDLYRQSIGWKDFFFIKEQTDNIDVFYYRDNNTVFYDLRGCSVADSKNLAKGIYIINGKKIMVK